MDLVKGYHVMVGYDNLIFGPAVPGAGRNGIAVGDSRLNVSGKWDGESVDGSEDVDSDTHAASTSSNEWIE